MTLVPKTNKWEDKTEYNRAKRSINSLSREMNQELTQLQNLHAVELQTTLSTISTSLDTLKQDISYENRDNLKKAWDNFTLRTEDGATEFLNIIQNEE